VDPLLLVKAIPAILPEISLRDFQTRLGMVSQSTCKQVIEYLFDNGIGYAFQDRYLFSNSDRIKLAVLALKNGNDVEFISKLLSWRDFEMFASEILNLSGYVTESNLRFNEPRRIEIDVVGTDLVSKLAVLIDCKHWRRNDLKSISLYAKKQIHRASIFLSNRENISGAIPVILTLYPMTIKIIEQIPVVPIRNFISFVSDLPLYLHNIKLVSR
jgi:hypothetical protein